MRSGIGKWIARYEHAARRSQTLLWVIIAINTFIEVVWGVLPIEIVLLIYLGGGFGLLMLGYISHRAKIGRAIVKTQFDIENVELWFATNNLGYALLAKYMKMPEEELDRALAHWAKVLNVDLIKGDYGVSISEEDED